MHYKLLCRRCLVKSPFESLPHCRSLKDTMLKDLAFLLVIRCPNGLFTLCTRCTRIVGSHGCLLRHILTDHASERKEDIRHVEELLKSRPDLQSIIDTRRFVLLDAWPVDVLGN